MQSGLWYRSRLPSASAEASALSRRRKSCTAGRSLCLFLLKSIEFPERGRKRTRARERSIETEIFNPAMAEILRKHDGI